MITIGYSTRKSNPTFISYLKESCGLKDVQVIEKVNPDGISLTKIYNEILDESEFDIVVLCHDDIYFEKNYWGKRLTEHFEKKDGWGILGVAGTTFYPSSGRWWEISSEMVGQVWHEHDGKKWLSEYNKSFGGKVIETVIVDGLFISIKKSKIQKRFNEEVEGFHFYDTTFCLENFLSDVKIGTVSNVNITHKSIGMTNEEWEKNRLKFVENFKESLPIKLKSNYPILSFNKNLPLVSVIIPIYNYGVMFEKCLNSVFESTYKNLEIIIINDGSTDEYVLKKLESLSGHPNIKIINQDNSGPSSARNNGVKNSNGKYILPLDADDMIHPDYIKTCVSILKTNQQFSPIYCDTQHYGEIQGIEKRPEWSMSRLKQGPFIVNCSMFSRDAFDSCEGFDENLKGWEDYDFWIRMGLNGYVGKRIAKPLFYYFHHEKDGTVSTLANQNQNELYKKIMDKNFKSNRLFDKFDKTFLINLKKREDRLNNFISQVNKFNLGEFELFEAVDGSLLETENPYLKKGEMGIIHSTIKILEKAIQQKYESILLVEDDCEFNQNILDIDSYFASVPSDWDMIYFGGNHNIHGGSQRPQKINDRIVRLHNTYAAHCIAIHSRMFKILIEHLKQFHKPSDVIYQQLQHKHNFYCFEPLVATQSPGYSDIQNMTVDYNWIIK